jgi:hypothetical protein
MMPLIGLRVSRMDIKLHDQILFKMQDLFGMLYDVDFGHLAPELWENYSIRFALHVRPLKVNLSKLRKFVSECYKRIIEKLREMVTGIVVYIFITFVTLKLVLFWSKLISSLSLIFTNNPQLWNLKTSLELCIHWPKLSKVS